MNRKGISPILASVLLLAVTLSVVGVFSGWAPQIAETVQGETENKTLHRLQCDKASVDIVSASYNTSGGEDLVVAVRNTGREDLDNLTVTEFDENDVLGEQTDLSVSAGELNDANISSGVETSPSYVRVYSEKCGSVTAETTEITE